MNSIFLRIDKGKRERIINASLNVFSKNDFKHASTDDIASKAGIAKGSLFQYFKNKRGLYIFLYEYALKTLTEKSEEQFDFDERDFFEIIKKGMLLKLKVLKEYPDIYNFVIKANEEKDIELANTVEKINMAAEKNLMEKAYGNIDCSKFHDGTDITLLTKMVNWCAEGLRNECLKNMKDYSDMQEEALEVISFFKKAVYKEKYINQ